MEEFPPQSGRLNDIESLVSVLRTAVPDRAAVYVSAPLTSGLRYAVWRSGLGRKINEADPEHGAERIRQVVELNRDEVGNLVGWLRGHHSVVIDPTALTDSPGWTQSDYRVLWRTVIERYVSTVVFADGWQYSNGCAYEYLIAVRKGVQTVDATEEPIDATKARRMITEAIRELDEHRTPSDFLRCVLGELKELSNCS